VLEHGQDLLAVGLQPELIVRENDATEEHRMRYPSVDAPCELYAVGRVLPESFPRSTVRRRPALTSSAALSSSFSSESFQFGSFQSSQTSSTDICGSTHDAATSACGKVSPFHIGGPTPSSSFFSRCAFVG